MVREMGVLVRVLDVGKIKDRMYEFLDKFVTKYQENQL